MSTIKAFVQSLETTSCTYGTKFKIAPKTKVEFKIQEDFPRKKKSLFIFPFFLFVVKIKLERVSHDCHKRQGWNKWVLRLSPDAQFLLSYPWLSGWAFSNSNGIDPHPRAEYLNIVFKVYQFFNIFLLGRVQMKWFWYYRRFGPNSIKSQMF